MTGALIAVCAVLVLLPRSGSIVGGVGADTVAVFTIGSASAASTAKVVVIVWDVPTASGPRVHGKAVVQAPPLDTNVSPAGVGSVTVAPATSDGPLFVIVRVYVTLVPGVGVSGPVLTISRSAMGVTFTESLTWNGGSPPGVPSGSIVAVLVTVPAVFGAAATWKLTTADWPGSIWPGPRPRLFTGLPAANGIVPPAASGTGSVFSRVVPGT